MKTVYIIVEGQTEEKFVKDLLYDYFITFNICTIPIIFSTKREASGGKFKGGGVNFDKLKNEILKISQKNSLITTMIDYYGIDENFPGYKESLKLTNYQDKAKCIENEIAKINRNNFIPYIQMYEFEALIFSDIDKVEYINNERVLLNNLKSDVSIFNSPEEINNSKNTAPSKRLLQYYPNYKKTIDGIVILKEIGIDNIKSKCKHFSDWIDKIKIIGVLK